MLMSSLSEKKYREKEGLFLAEGLKLFREAGACGMSAELVAVHEDRRDLLETVTGLMPDIPVYVLSDSAFSKVSSESAPQGLITAVRFPRELHSVIRFVSGAVPEDCIFPKPDMGKAIALESVRDPGNLGTVIRSAAAFGIGTVILSADCADIYNPKTVRGAMGALFSTRIVRVSDLGAAIDALNRSGRRTFAAALMPGAAAFGSFELKADDVFVIGNEGHGLSEEVINACREPVFIPMRTGPGIESLNAAVAASVIMFGLSGKN